MIILSQRKIFQCLKTKPTLKVVRQYSELWGWSFRLEEGKMELVIVYNESTNYIPMEWAENRAMEWIVVSTNCVWALTQVSTLQLGREVHSFSSAQLGMWFYGKTMESTLFKNFAQEFHELQQQLHEASVNLSSIVYFG